MATNGPDTLKGTNRADVIKGGGGKDVIFGYDGNETSPLTGQITATLVGAGFAGAVFAGSAPGRPDELFVVRKDAGEIHILDPATDTATLFLNIPDGELTTGGEQGLLGLAFHPDFEENGEFFVHLVNADGNIEIRQYVRSAGDADTADPDPERTLITIPHPFGNHNGGALAFGPNDDYLYIAVGDGGGSNDPDNNGQNINTLLGTILRIDVDGDDFDGDDTRNYAIPADNPFVGAAGADEIWAWGLRNPWRIAFDENGDLFIADVGQHAREEINFQPFNSPGGVNYGWDLAEGTLGNPPPGSVLPVHEYERQPGNAVVGGYVYRGAEASLEGAYVFSDFGSAALWTLRIVNGLAVDVTNRTSQLATPDGAPTQVSSFGVDGNGGLYLVTLTGSIYRLDADARAGDVGDTLKGGTGADKIYGGPGDDFLAGNKGADRLSGGFGDDEMLGGKGGDRLLGGEGDDLLDGDTGKDVLRGDGGADRFRFDSEPGNKNVDRIKDFDPDTDVILLARSVFRKIGGSLGDDAFHVGAKAADRQDRIIYNPDNGKLFHDDNGSRSGGKTLFAKLDDGLALDAADFLMI